MAEPSELPLGGYNLGPVCSARVALLIALLPAALAARPGAASPDTVMDASSRASGASARSAALGPAAQAVLEPASSGGIEAIDSALARLSIHARLLVVGAHPDDEDNALLTYVSRGLGGEAAYLSLSRGEGGQNLIGPELGEQLGLIRTGELMAARRIEGTRQYFARAYDFGYTRSLEEAFERWPREVLREDAVRAARRFKPQVVVAIFPPDARAGHGQHQASAVIAADVFELAGDPAAFPHLGLGPWAPSAHYRRAWSREDATLGFTLGALDPISGRSIAQIAAESRSRHRSQDMGRTEPIGVYQGGLRWIGGGAGEASDGPFAGIDTRLASIASSLPAGELRDRLEAGLGRVERLARNARPRVAPVALESAVGTFQDIVRELRDAAGALGDSPGESVVADLLAEKMEVAETGLAAAAGIVVEALADRERIPVGDAFQVTASVWPTGRVPVEVEAVTLRSPSGWLPGDGTAVEEPPERELRSWSYRVEIPEGAAGSTPYYLERARVGDLYDWTGAPEWLRGEAAGTDLIARFEIVVAGTPIVLEREVVYRYADQAAGEIRRPLRAVPAVEITVDPDLSFVSSREAKDVELGVTVSSNLEAELSGRLLIRVPDGWPQAPQMDLTLAPGDRVRRRFELAGVRPEPGLYELRVEFVAESGRSFSAAYPVLDYSHVRPAGLRMPATAQVRALSIELPDLERVGYVRGASDRVPEQLEKVGIPIELLDLGGEETGDLSVFDAIVIGSRAYEIDPSLRENNAALMRYLEGGGLLIVQYQQYQFVHGGFAPRPIEIGQPHGRITDETSAVRMLEPRHSAFSRPNRIGPEDWQGWVQERGLYFAEAWDEAYEPLLALQDPGDQPEQRGALLVAEVGAGTYVYTGLSFFRELPAGVPGAFRLFANLLSLGEQGRNR